MGKTNDFLWQGKAPPNVNTNSTTTTQVPAYLQQYHEGVLARANKIAARPYQTYDGQRLASVDPSLQQSWQQGTQAATSYQPYFQTAGNLLNQAGGYSATNAANPYLASAGGAYQTAANYAAQGAGANVPGAAQPHVNTASGLAQQAANTSVSGAAAPHMQAAGQTAYQNVGAYLSPYQTAVVDQIARKGQENLQSSLHTLGDDFIRSGSLGSSRHMSAVGKAMSDTQEAVSNAQSAALNQGYQTALGAAQNDMSRYAQLAGLSGQFAQNEATNKLNAGTLEGNLGQTMGNLTNAGAQNALTAGNLEANIGQGQGALGQIAGNFASIDQKNTMDLANANAALGKNYQSAGLTGAAAMEAIGRDKMGLEQQSLDLAYQDWANQNDYARQNADWLATLTRGQPDMGGTVYKDSNAPLPGSTYQPSGIQQIAGGLSLMNGLSTMFKAKGGYVDCPPGMKSDGYKTAGKRPPPVRIRRMKEAA